MSHFAQCEACKRELIILSEQKKENCADADNKEDNNSSAEGEDDNMITFERSIPDEAPVTKSGI